MALKEVTELKSDKTINIGGYDKKTRLDHPTSILGYYLGSTVIKSKNPAYKDSVVHTFQTKEGNVGVWARGNMTKLLEAGNAIGCLTEVRFDKMVALKSGTQMYGYKVAVDADNTVEVSNYSSIEDEDLAQDDIADEEINPVAVSAPTRGVAAAPTSSSTDAVRSRLANRTRL